MEKVALITLIITSISVIVSQKLNKTLTVVLCLMLTLMGCIYVFSPYYASIAAKMSGAIALMKNNAHTVSLCTAFTMTTLMIILILKRKKKTAAAKPTIHHQPPHAQEMINKTGTTKLPPKIRRHHTIDPTVKKYLPYSVNRSLQIEKMEDSLLEPKIAHQLIWLVHGNEDQCIEELINCVQLFYWKSFYCGENATLPEIIPIECPDASSKKSFERLMENRIKIKVRKPNQSKESSNQSNLMQSLDQYHNGPIILCTTLKTPNLRDWNTSIITHLETFRKNLGQRESGLPLILCIIVIYNEDERTWRKDRKFNQKIRLVIENFSDITLPELSNIPKDDIDKWKKHDFVGKYLSSDLDLSELHKLYQTPAYRNGMPMYVLADEIKNRYFS